MLKISKADYDLIRWEAERSYPQECCGILLGKVTTPQQANTTERSVTLTLTCENNRRDSPGNRYSIHPEQLIAGLKLARNRGETIVGFYHSHPDHPAQWSKTDFAEAHWIGCSYVITSVAGGIAQQTNSFLLTGTSEDDKSFEDETIQVEELVAGRC